MGIGLVITTEQENILKSKQVVTIGKDKERQGEPEKGKKKEEKEEPKTKPKQQQKDTITRAEVTTIQAPAALRQALALHQSSTPGEGQQRGPTA